MRQKPDDAERMAMQRELREGRDPFNASFDAGAHDAAFGKLYRDSFRRGKHDEAVYNRGWEYARQAKISA